MVKALGGSLNGITRYEEVIEGIEGDGKEYVLKAASSQTVERYKQSQFAKLKFGANGKLASIDANESLDLQLISECLFRREGGKEVGVSRETIGRWTFTTKKALINQIRAVSDMDEGDSAEKLGLKLALSQPGSPIPFEALRDFIDTLQGEDFDQIKATLADVENDPKK